jgi:hypothetical protein
LRSRGHVDEERGTQREEMQQEHDAQLAPPSNGGNTGSWMLKFLGLVNGAFAVFLGGEIWVRLVGDYHLPTCVLYSLHIFLLVILVVVGNYTSYGRCILSSED